MLVACEHCGARNRVPSARLKDKAVCGSCKQAMPLDAPRKLSSVQEFEELVQTSPIPVLVDFWAPWCPPCRQVAPELEKLAKQKHGEAVVAKVDTEALPALAARYGIRSIPTFVLFTNGRERQRSSGAQPAAQLAQTFHL